MMACGSDPCAQSSGIVVRRWTPASVGGAAVGLGGESSWCIYMGSLGFAHLPSLNSHCHHGLCSDSNSRAFGISGPSDRIFYSQRMAAGWLSSF